MPIDGTRLVRSGMSLGGIVAFGLAGAAGPQLPVERRLDGPATRLSHDFVSITSVRELRDGRVLVTDPRGDLFAVADFARDTVERIGRKGRGPGEYDWPGPLWRLGGDSTVMTIASSRRWLLVVGARIVSTLPSDAPGVSLGLFPLGADSLGRVLMSVESRPQHGVHETGARDSTALVLLHRRTGTADTIARRRKTGARVEAELDAAGRVKRISSKHHSPLEVEEAALLFLDGWVAVVRREPYRVDWRTPAGSWRVGAAIPIPKIRVDRREREAAVRFFAEQGGTPPPSPDTFDRWPEFLPAVAPFRSYPVVPTTEGMIAIRRTRSARAPDPRYDIVDRTGRVVQRLVLDPGEAIVAFGRGMVYLVRTDAEGAQYLIRKVWNAVVR